MGPSLNANAEAADGRVIPYQPFWFGKAFDQPAECPYSGIRSCRVLGNFEVRAVFSALPPHEEDMHLRAEALDERPQIMPGVDVEIDVPILCRRRTAVL